MNRKRVRKVVLVAPGSFGSIVTRRLAPLRGSCDKCWEIPFPPPNAPEVLVLYGKRAGSSTGGRQANTRQRPKRIPRGKRHETSEGLRFELNLLW